MNSFLIVLIAFKLICLFFCWKGISRVKRGRNQLHNNNSSQEWQEAQTRMSQLMEQNRQLTESIKKMKDTNFTTDDGQKNSSNSKVL